MYTIVVTVGIASITDATCAEPQLLFWSKAWASLSCVGSWTVAARCTTASTPSTARSRERASRMSASTNRAGLVARDAVRIENSPRERLSRTTTSSTAGSRSRDPRSEYPTYPAPPVTRTFIAERGRDADRTRSFEARPSCSPSVGVVGPLPGAGCAADRGVPLAVERMRRNCVVGEELVDHRVGPVEHRMVANARAWTGHLGLERRSVGVLVPPNTGDPDIALSSDHLHRGRLVEEAAVVGIVGEQQIARARALREFGDRRSHGARVQAEEAGDLVSVCQRVREVVTGVEEVHGNRTRLGENHQHRDAVGLERRRRNHPTTIFQVSTHLRDRPFNFKAV